MKFHQENIVGCGWIELMEIDVDGLIVMLVGECKAATCKEFSMICTYKH